MIKYKIGVFTDRKGFTRTEDFIVFPMEYSFIEYEPVKVTVISQSCIDTESPKNKELVFIKDGDEINTGYEIIQRYKQKDY